MPSLVEEAVAALVQAESADWLAAIPAKVVAVGDGTVDAQPLVRRKYLDSYSDRPVVSDVPVVLPVAGVGAIELELSVGDIVLLVCASRSIDEVRESGWNLGSPQDARRFSLSDAFAIPFRAAAPAVTTLRLVDGKVALGSESVDVVSVLYQLLGVLQTATSGGYTFDPVTLNTLSTLSDAIATIKE